MAYRSGRTSVGYVVVEVTSDTTAKRSLRGINPDCTDSDLVDVLHSVGQLQSHTVNKYSRQNFCELVAD